MTDYGKIAVFAGGPSNEREISLQSGRAVYEALKRRTKKVDFVDVMPEFNKKINLLMYDIVFLALHGAFGEDGTIQAILEERNMSYTGSGVRASHLAMDKIASREAFLANGLRAPKYRIAERNSDTKDVTKGLELPFVVKPRRGGSSIGLSVVKDKSGLNSALEKAFQHDDTAIVEEYVHGKELTVGILEERPLPIIEIATKESLYDFKAKYFDSETKYILPAELKEDDYKRTQECALKAHHILGCRDFSRVDIRMDGLGNIYILEVNTIPGMTERSLLPKAARVAGISFEDLCIRLVDSAYKRKEKQHGEK